MSRLTARIGGLDLTDVTEAHDGPAAVSGTAEPARAARKSFVATGTLRRHHLAMPGRITRSGRQTTLHLPSDWPWDDEFNHMLSELPARSNSRSDPNGTLSPSSDRVPPPTKIGVSPQDQTKMPGLARRLRSACGRVTARALRCPRASYSLTCHQVFVRLA